MLQNDNNLVTITDRAIEKVKEFTSAENKQDAGLRVYVSGGGCSGLTYGMSLDNNVGDDDISFEASPGLKIIIDPISAKYLKGSSVDYVESIEESGFKIQNPNVKSSCGCGHSFKA